MTWNYRVVKSEAGLSVYEVYYDKFGMPIATSAEPVLNFFCDTVEAIQYEITDRIMAALNEPILRIEDIGSDSSS